MMALIASSPRSPSEISWSNSIMRKLTDHITGHSFETRMKTKRSQFLWNKSFNIGGAVCRNWRVHCLWCNPLILSFYLMVDDGGPIYNQCLPENQLCCYVLLTWSRWHVSFNTFRSSPWMTSAHATTRVTLTWHIKKIAVFLNGGHDLSKSSWLKFRRFSPVLLHLKSSR